MLELTTFHKTSKSINVYRSTQKEKENDKLINKDKGVYGLPKLHFLTQALIRNKYIEDTDLELQKYNLILEEVIF